ncbi:DUF4150 domain-containing protein [Burkholderia ubonensis]|uniref:DUF4150 domain-containing protein n=1 Tax=Burkholderia ubonensis TaxID=101571 RepID=UPI0009B2F7A5|nr:DUF4150 domain-containing protein [Burkholderia ubonensis]
MAITINVNGLSLCHRGSGGVTHNTMPDVCKTPGNGTPVPYQNEAYSRDLVKGTTTVVADGRNSIANYGSQFARSVFDEAGSMGGITSGTNMAEADWISHSFDVLIEGKPACRLTDKMFMNHRNTINLAGESQDNLPQDELTKELCEMACECWNKHKPGGKEPLGQGQTFQDCMNKKIEEKYYDGKYPKPDSNLWREVPFDRGSNWDMIERSAKDGIPTSNYIRPNSRRLDLVELAKGEIKKLFDFKFPTDAEAGGNMDPKKLRDYQRITKKLTGDVDNLDIFDVADRCDDCDDPELKRKRAKALAPKPATAPATAPSQSSSVNPWLVAGGVALGALFVIGMFTGVSEVAGGLALAGAAL